MKISQLRQLIAVSACGSINKAAGMLYISQSALVSSINAAEAEVGQQILIRSYNGITLTEYGKTFVDGAQSILSIYDGLLRAAEPQQTLSLRVSCQFLRYASTIFADICTNYAKDAASLRFAEKTRDMVCQDLMNDVSDIGIIVVPSTSRGRVFQVMEENGIDYHIIDSPKACCMVGPKNPLYQKEEPTVTLAELSGYPLLLYEMSEWLWGKGAFAEDTAEFPHRRILTISDSGSFQRILSQTSSYFIGIYGKKAYSSTAFYENIRVLELADTDFRYDIIWLRRKDYALNALSRLFLRRIYEASGKRPEPGL